MDYHITTEQIMDLLPIVADNRTWTNNCGYIRSDANECPICAIINEINGTVKHTIFAGVSIRSLSLVCDDDVSAIVYAADDTGYGMSNIDQIRSIRARMIDILNPVNV